MTSSRYYHITVVAPTAPPVGAGGVTSAHFHLSRHLRKAGHEVTLLTFNEPKAFDSEPGLLRFGASPRTRWFLAIMAILYLKCRGSRRTGFHLADITSSASGAIRAGIALRKLSPDVVIMPDHGAPGLFFPKGNWRSILVSHNNPLRFIDNPLIGDFCPLDARIAVSLEQKVVTRADAVVCPSPYMAEVFRESYVFDGLSAVIPNGVDTEYINEIPGRNLRAELGMSAEAPVVYIPSAGSWLKGERYVFEIVRRLGGQHKGEIAFYLSGKLTGELQAELSHVPNNVRLIAPGHLNYRDNISYIKGCSFGVSPTLVENFSMAFLEAASCGVPMVSFDVGGNSSIIESGRTGYLVPLLDMDNLIDAASKLLSGEMLEEMQRGAADRVLKLFAWEPVARKYSQLFSCLGESLSEGR